MYVAYTVVANLSYRVFLKHAKGITKAIVLLKMVWNFLRPDYQVPGTHTERERESDANL